MWDITYNWLNKRNLVFKCFLYIMTVLTNTNGYYVQKRNYILSFFISAMPWQLIYVWLSLSKFKAICLHEISIVWFYSIIIMFIFNNKKHPDQGKNRKWQLSSHFYSSFSPIFINSLILI